MMKILAVDDEPMALDLYSDCLVSYGIQCSLFNNATDALAYLKHHQVDGIISDLQMPEMSGEDFFKEVKKLGRPCGVFVFITGKWHERFSYLLEQGVSKVFHKPFSPDEVAVFLKQFQESS